MLTTQLRYLWVLLLTTLFGSEFWLAMLGMRLVPVSCLTARNDGRATTDRVAHSPRWYPTEEFLEVYHWRWQHESDHLMLTGRLDLENWSGQTVEAVRQDVHAAVFVSNVETLLSQQAQEQLSAEDAGRQYPAQASRAVSYHALKERIFELLWSQRPLKELLEQLQRWMRCNPVSVRRNRQVPRRPQSFRRSYHHRRNLGKSVF